MSNKIESDEYRLSERRVLVRGAEFTVFGCRGTFQFVRHVRTEAGEEWIDCVGGPPGRVMNRSFDPSRVKTIKRAKG